MARRRPARRQTPLQRDPHGQPERAPRPDPGRPRTDLGAQYRRLAAARRGSKNATLAVGHTIPTNDYHLLTRSTTDRVLGPGYFDDREGVRHRLVGRFEKLGYKVTTEPTA